MIPSNPLQTLHERHDEVSFRPYGLGVDCSSTSSDIPTGISGDIQIVDSFGQYESEYAAIRKGIGVMDMPHLGLIEISGNDAGAFLHQMLTADITGLSSGQGGRSFFLNKTGRIMADAVVLRGDTTTHLVVDLFQASNLAQELEKYVFTEDARITHVSDKYFHLALHGPMGANLLNTLAGDPFDWIGMGPFDHRSTTLANRPCVVYRDDEAGSPGWHLLVARDDAVELYQAIQKTCVEESTNGGSSIHGRGRLIGWQAYNTARIEAGTPLYHIDFGPDTLPHETGILDQAVSFTKGCYLGQEVVARMQSLGHPKRVLVGLRVADHRLPIAGNQIFESHDQAETNGLVIGAVTSSTVSPMLGGCAIMLGMVKWGKHTYGTQLSVPAEGTWVDAMVQSLRFLKPATS